MDNKQVTFDYLDSLPDGWKFTGAELKKDVYWITHEQMYIATCLRYMREWRSTHRKIVCIHKGKSLYQMIGGK